MVIQDILKDYRDVEIITAVNGDEAVRQIQENMRQFYLYSNPDEAEKNLQDGAKVSEPVHFSAIIMDLNMPIMDGYEACQKIIEIYELYNNDRLCQKDSKNLEGKEIKEDQIGEKLLCFQYQKPLMLATTAHCTD